MVGIRISTGVAVVLVFLTASFVTAQIPGGDSRSRFASVPKSRFGRAGGSRTSGRLVEVLRLRICDSDGCDAQATAEVESG